MNAFSEAPIRVMENTYPEFDCSRLTLLPLSERKHNMDVTAVRELKSHKSVHPSFRRLSETIRHARDNGASVIMMMGAHVLRSGLQKYLIDLMEKGFISCIAVNGAAAIHDFELALIGATTESVAHYIKNGQFGLWTETGKINDVVKEGCKNHMGLGEAVGREILAGDYPFKHISVFAAGARLGIPVTVHVGIGYDIIHPFPNFDGAAFGAASHRDFLRFAHVMESLENGAVMNFGSAVMAPEVYLKALSMVRNVAAREGKTITRFTTLVCDLVSLPGDFHTEAGINEPGYYFRPWKTMLVRTVADGGESHYVQGPHKETLPQLWTALMEE